MKISDLIKHLEQLKEQHGDVEVQANNEVGELKSFNKNSVYGYNARGIWKETKVLIDA